MSQPQMKKACIGWKNTDNKTTMAPTLLSSAAGIGNRNGAGMKIIYDSMNAKSSGENDACNQIKKIGKAGFSGDAPAAYEKVEAVCKSAGLFVVPVGEMEFVVLMSREKVIL